MAAPARNCVLRQTGAAICEPPIACLAHALSSIKQAHTAPWRRDPGPTREDEDSLYRFLLRAAPTGRPGTSTWRRRTEHVRMKRLYRGSALQLALFPLVETEAHRLRADGFQSEDGPLTAPPFRPHRALRGRTGAQLARTRTKRKERRQRWRTIRRELPSKKSATVFPNLLSNSDHTASVTEKELRAGSRSATSKRHVRVQPPRRPRM